MDGYLKQSTAAQVRWIGPFVDDTDFKTAETGLTVANTDIKVSKNGGSSASKNSGGGTHDVNGMYAVTWDATDTATVGELKYSVKVAGALQVFGSYVVVEEVVYDMLFGASALGYIANAPVNVAQISGDSTSADNLESYTDGTTPIPANVTQFGGTNATASGGRPEVNTTHAAGTAWGSGAITAASIADGAIDAATFAAGAINAAAIASAAFTKAKFGNDTGLTPALSGTASAGSGTTITLAGGVATNDYYNGSLVFIVAGVGAGQSRIITDYVGGTTVATVDAWITNPDNTSVFVVIPSFAVADIAALIWNALIATYSGTSGSTAQALSAAGGAGDPWITALPGAYGAGTAGKIIGDNLNATISSRSSQATQDTIDGIVDQLQLDTDDIQTRLPAALVGGRMDANVGAVSADATAADNLEAALDGTGGVTITAALTGNITGNLSGSVGSVTGAVGSVTGAVGSVTGAVGSVTGAVGSVTGAVGSVAANGVSASSLAADAVAEIAAGILTAAAADPIAADVQEVNAVPLVGDGNGTPWGPS